MLSTTSSKTIPLQFAFSRVIPSPYSLPTFVTLTVTECEPGVRGDTATGANKPPPVETGLKIVVPLFVNEGDKVRIDTRTGEYMERV